MRRFLSLTVFIGVLFVTVVACFSQTVNVGGSVTATVAYPGTAKYVCAMTAYPGYASEKGYSVATINLSSNVPNVTLKITGIYRGQPDKHGVIHNPLNRFKYTPSSLGTLTKTGPTTWTYTAYTEATSDKHAVPLEIMISPYVGSKKINKAFKVAVHPVFFYYSMLSRPGFQWNYVVWKYGISLGSNKDIGYDPSVHGYGRTATTRTHHNYSRLGPNCFMSELSGSTDLPFSLGENVCASTILHENTHRYQYWKWIVSDDKLYASESQAYTVEINSVGITGLDGAILQDTRDGQKHYLDRVNHRTPTTNAQGDDPNGNSPIDSSNSYYAR